MLADIHTWMICKVDFTDVKTAGYLYKSSPPRCVLHQKQLFIVSSELSLPEERNDLLFVMCVWCSISALTSVTLIRVLDRSAWHIQPFLSLLHAHRRFIGGGGKLAIFAAQPLLLPASWRQLIIPSLNLIHFLCAKPSRCVLLLVWGEQDCHIQPPTTLPAKLASHCGKSSICSCYPSNQSLVAKVQVPPYEHVSQSIMTYFLLCLNWFIYMYLFIHITHIKKKQYLIFNWYKLN